MTPRRIIGVEKNYDWGDENSIRESLGVPPTSGTKIAELWWGTHPQGPAHLDSPDGPLMSDVTGNMTMLVKLLACSTPLSLQTHPTIEQAREGFAREEAAGIDRDAPHRMYRDDSDKPEMLVALSTFEALCGFMPTNDAVDLLRSLSWSREADFLESNGTRSYMAWAFEQSDTPDMTRVPSWLSRIASLYPADKALRVAPLLNHVVLEKGEALALPAGNLHAYLRGFGLEVMKSSDNVIRAGFTSKHIDVAELLHIVDCAPLTQPKAHLDPNASAEVFTSPSAAFSVGRFDKTRQDTDHHRIVFGIRRDEKPHGTPNELPAAYLLVAGDTDAVDFDDAWVCTQH